MFLLTSSRLRVEVSEPMEQPNTGFRFDQAAFISDVTLDGTCHFAAAEPQNLIHSSSSGRGLCCEYSADYSAEAQQGEWYPKFGVGLIQKNGPYQFWQRYDQVQRFDIEYEHDDCSATFATKPLPCMGYAARITKKIEVKENNLRLTGCMENVGDKTIDTEEYCHNFLSIDGMSITPDYRLILPSLSGSSPVSLVNRKKQPTNFIASHSGVSFLRTDPAVSLADLALDSLDTRTPFCWEMHCDSARARVFCKESFSPSRITLWATDHIFSPEVVQRIIIRPREKYTWSRWWTFERDTVRPYMHAEK